MMNFLINNFYRIANRKYYVVISLLMTLVAISSAVYFTGNQEMKASIAVVTAHPGEWAIESSGIHFTLLAEEPPTHLLVLGKYDGIIFDKGNGQYQVKTIKNDDFRTALEELAANPKEYVLTPENSRGLGTNVVGYLIMFILMQSVLYMFVLAEDIEFKLITRIAAAPVSFVTYLLSHYLCAFVLIFVPIMMVLAVMKGVLGMSIGFSLWHYGLFIMLISSLGIAFALFINSLIKGADTANMIGSSLVVLTTILSGSFFSFGRGNELLEKIIWILPQKAFLNLVQGLEEGIAFLEILPQLFYVIVLTLLLLGFSILKIKKDYVLRKN